MSRTHEEGVLKAHRRYKRWEEEHPTDWRVKQGGYPQPLRGANHGQKIARKFRWGAERTRERNALSRLEEPEPARTRGQVRWDLH